MKSSSIPPAVATMQSTILCWHRKRIVSRTPHEAMLLVYPRKMVALVFLRTSGSLNSSDSSGLTGSSLRGGRALRRMESNRVPPHRILPTARGAGWSTSGATCASF